MAKITYEDKEFLNKNENIADKNKVNDTDLNEIKEVVNGNDDNIGNLSNLNTTNKDSLVNAVNEINSHLEETILYKNNAHFYVFSINDDASNYKYFIVRIKGNIYPDYLKEETLLLVNPNNKSFSHCCCWYNSSNNQMYGGNFVFTISGTNVTIDSDSAGTVGANNAYGASAPLYTIIEILGYK